METGVAQEQFEKSRAGVDNAVISRGVGSLRRGWERRTPGNQRSGGQHRPVNDPRTGDDPGADNDGTSRDSDDNASSHR